MSFTGKHYNFYDQPSRLFLMDASMFGVPFQVFHRFVGPSATMRVKVASVVAMVDAKGPEMDEAETVTLFNDLCVFAPGALIGRGIHWQEIDPQTVGASFTNVSHTVRAVLSFNERGEPTDFVADGRARFALSVLKIDGCESGHQLYRWRLKESAVVRMPSAYGVPANPNSRPNLPESKRYGESL